MTDPATMAFYDREAPRYTTSFGRRPSRHLEGFLDRLTPRARVLELGCGGGRDAGRIAERGFALDATDGSAAMAAKARERTGLAVRHMRFDELDAVAEYDAVWANACLLHVPRAEIAQVLGAIRESLRPGGWHFASYKLGTGEGRDLLGRLHNFPDERWISAAYGDAGFALEHTAIYRGEGADGTVRDWIAITARKPE